MKICFLTYDTRKPSTQYRVVQWVPHLQRRGWTVDVRVLPGGSAARYLDLLRLPRTDVLVIQKRLLPLPLLLWVRSRAQRLVYDYDDSVMLRQRPDANGDYGCRRRMRRFARTVRACDCVVAGNEELAACARDCGASNVEVIPTVPADLMAQPFDDAPAPETGSGNVVLGWIGTRSNLAYLEPLREVFLRLAARHPSMRIHIMADARPTGLEGAPVVFREWSRPGQEAALARFDIGIMPLPDNPWTRGKCGFKLLQYLAAAKPVVCSPVGVNARIVRNGVNGFAAGTPEEWETALETLIADGALRRRLGEEGRVFLRREYDPERWAQAWCRILSPGA